MDTKNTVLVRKDACPGEYDRAVGQLRAAAGRAQVDAHRQRIRAATRC